MAATGSGIIAPKIEVMANGSAAPRAAPISVASSATIMICEQ